MTDSTNLFLTARRDQEALAWATAVDAVWRGDLKASSLVVSLDPQPHRHAQILNESDQSIAVQDSL